MEYKAINEEFVQIKDQLESYLYRISANREDTEDLLHDTYLKVGQKIHLFSGNSTFKTWVFAIATNLAKDNKRVKNRWKVEAQDDCKFAAITNPSYRKKIIDAFQSQSEKKFEIEEHINYCFTCISKNLNLEKQISIILKEFYHFKRSEIAQILGKTENIIKHFLFEGRKELQTKYENRCALINKNGVCYQCAELNDFLQEEKNSAEKIQKTGLKESNTPEENLDIRFSLINKINPLKSNASELEKEILQILREVIKDE